jgi:hypothetical protein
MIERKEVVSLFCRGMANVENDVEMSGWDRRRIQRIGDLADKAAVFAQGCREALTHAGWAVLHNS